MLANYAELVLVLTPWRYDTPCMVSFDQPLYGLPRERSRELRSWLVKNFELTLDPPVFDDFTNDTRMAALMAKSLSSQACTLFHSIRHRRKLGVCGANATHGDKEKEITPGQVLKALNADLSEFPGFSMSYGELLNPPSSYCWPSAPHSSRYLLKKKETSFDV